MNDRFEALERLAKLRDLNVLTPEEFAAEKARILEGTSSPPAEPLDSQQSTPSSPPSMRNWRPLVLGGLLTIIVGSTLGYVAINDINSVERSPQATAKKSSSSSLASSTFNEDLDLVFSFNDAKSCEPGAKLQKLLDALAAETGAEGRIAIPGSRSVTTTTFQKLAGHGGDTAGTAMAKVTGTWNGLKVTSVRTVTWIGTGVSSFQIRFAEPVQKVRQTLTGQGFALDKVGVLSNVGGNGVARVIGLEEIESGTALTCGRAATSNAASRTAMLGPGGAMGSDG